MESVEILASDGVSDNVREALVRIDDSGKTHYVFVRLLAGFGVGDNVREALAKIDDSGETHYVLHIRVVRGGGLMRDEEAEFVNEDEVLKAYETGKVPAERWKPTFRKPEYSLLH